MPAIAAIVLAIGLMGGVVQRDVNVPTGMLVAIIGGVGLALFAAGLLHPEVPLLALTAYVPFSRVLAGDFGGLMTAFNLTNILMGVVLVGYVLRMLAQHQPLLERSTLNVPIFLFCALGAVSLIRGILAGYNEGYAAFFIVPLKRWLTPMLLYYIVYNVVQEKRTIKQLLVIMMVVVAVVAAMAIKDYIDVGDSSLEKSRIGGIAEQPNVLGSFFVYYMFFFAAFWLENLRTAAYWLLPLLFLACFRGIMVTFSRGAYLAFACGLYALSFFRNKACWIVLVLIGVFVWQNPWLLPKGVAYRMGETVHEWKANDLYESDAVNTLDASAYQRLVIWRGAIEMIKQNPWWGVGYGAFPYLIDYYAPLLNIQRDAHNSYLLIAAEMGIPTLLVFLWIIGLAFWKTRWLYRHAKDPFFRAMALGWLAGLAGLLVANAFGSRLHSEEISSYFWMLCGLVMRAIVIERREQQAAAAAEAAVAVVTVKPVIRRRLSDGKPITLRKHRTTP